MKKNVILIGTGIAACAIAGLVFATKLPATGLLFSHILSIGTHSGDINTHVHVSVPGQEEGWSAQLETEGATDVHTTDAAYIQGGTTHWHTHPGILLLTLAADSGPIDWYDSNCHKTVYKAGDSWTEGTSLHDVVVNDPAGAHFSVTYVLAKGQPRRIDQEPPACAKGTFLDQP
jgi:hypothetical protein